MLKPETPADEATRVDTLRALKILDTPPEERFDRLTRLARRLFGVPIALVSLVDSNRQWFKSCMGLDASETPRDVSFCGHAIHGDDIFLIPDASADERFKDNPLVTGPPHIRFYAGCPLSVGDGSKLGTLCVIDREPRVFDEEELELLRDLARMAEQELTAIQLATMDELTLLSNRRGFMALGAQALSLCERMRRSVSLMYFDLDRFKQINDEFGHAEGDRALAGFAEALSRTFRDSDVIGRLGGDEFAVLVTGAGEEGVRQALARLEEAVDGYNAQAGRGYRIAYSVGAVELDLARHATIESMMAEADAMMYERKRARRVDAA